jgi:hypothetical protein
VRGHGRGLDYGNYDSCYPYTGVWPYCDYNY